MSIPTVSITSASRLFAPNGVGIVSGTVVVKLSQPATVLDGTVSQRVGGEMHATITNGVLGAFALVPNDAMTPSGTYYLASFHVKFASERTLSWDEKWKIPSSPSTLDIGAVPRLDENPGVAIITSQAVADAVVAAAQLQANAAAIHATTAGGSATTATNAALAAAAAALDAAAAKLAAEAAQAGVAASASAATGAAAAASTSASGAATAKTGAETAASAASTSASGATASALDASGHDTAALASASSATTAKIAAEAARDASLVAGKVYVDTTTGLAATTEGSYFNVPSALTGESFILYRKESGLAVEKKRYPSTTGVALTNASAQIRNAYQPFTTYQSPLGDGEMLGDGNNDYTAYVVGFHKQMPEDTVFNMVQARVRQVSGTAAVQWKIFIRDTATGFNMSSVTADASGTFAAADCPKYSSTISIPLSAPLMAAASKWVFVMFYAPGDTGMVQPTWTYNAGVSPARVGIAIGISAGVGWNQTVLFGNPTAIYGETAIKLSLSAYEFGARGITSTTLPLFDANQQIRGGFVPYLGYQHPRGDAEMVGTGTYGAVNLGYYEQITQLTTFNMIKCRVYAVDPTANIEWKVWVMEDLSFFNMGTVAADDSGTILAADIPHAQGVTYSLRLNKAVRVPAGKYVLLMFRATNDTYVVTPLWAHDAGASPARHGFPMATFVGWNHNWGISTEAIGYGQSSIILALESGEARYSTPGYSNLASGLSATDLQGATDELAAASFAAPHPVLPAIFYVTQGRELSIYLDNLIEGNASDYVWETVCANNGVQQNERYVIVPTGAIASTPLTVKVFGRSTGKLLSSTVVNLVGAATSAGAGTTPKIILIGDSTTAGGNVTGELLNIASTDAMSLLCLGTKGTGANKHEGRGGWSAAAYTTNYSDVPSGANPFWIAGAVNFPQYLVNNSLATPDWVFINLGLNEVSVPDDVAALAAATAAFDKYDTLITSIKAAGVGVKVGLCCTTLPSSDQDSSGANYGTALQRARIKRNIIIRDRLMLSRYGGQTANRIYVVPTHLNLDTVNNMSRAAAANVNSRSTIQISRQGNAVHPDNPGYYQIADLIWSFLKNQ